MKKLMRANLVTLIFVAGILSGYALLQGPVQPPNAEFRADPSGLSINGVMLGMPRSVVEVLPSRFERYEKLSDSHHTISGSPWDLYGVTLNGYDECTAVLYDGMDRVQAVKGSNLFRGHQPVVPGADGALPIPIGDPVDLTPRTSDIAFVKKYSQPPLVVMTKRRNGEAYYLLGSHPSLTAETGE